MARKKKRRARVTKDDIKKIREDRKITSYQRKKIIKPGPWTETETTLKVNADIRLNNDGIMASILGPAKGSYLRDEFWSEKGWYPIVFNIEAKRMNTLVARHGMDQFLAACEKTLNNKLDKKGKPMYGKIIILRMSVDNSQRKDKSRRFISCRGKTNRKEIPGFMAVRKKEYVRL
ncbi:unnamed protein product [marine sediment metagenome]|uniref:Uncharacterized protein n=1 Tax=marine sediment metagenome TaxID=412755 RepID=X1C1Y7_9ZZZZ